MGRLSAGATGRYRGGAGRCLYPPISAGDLPAPACASRGLRRVLRAVVEALSRPEGDIPLISSSPRFFETALPVSFGGSSAEPPHAFRWYDKNRIVAGKGLWGNLCFAFCFWQSF